MNRISHIQFNNPVPVMQGRSIGYWSASSPDGRDIRVELSERGVLLRPGRTVGSDWRPLGPTVIVPWQNINSIVEQAPDEQPVSTDTMTPVRARTRVAREAE